MIKHIVTHANCPDGVASAIIMKRAYKEARVSFVQYGKPSLLEIEAEQGMLFVDMTPPRERLKEFLMVNAVVLDHHETQKDIVLALGGTYGENDKLECGAALAFDYCKRNARLHPNYLMWYSDFAFLAAVRDTWQRDSPSWTRACEQASVLVTLPPETFFDMPEERLHTLFKDIGPGLYTKQLARAESAAHGAWRDNCQGVSYALLQDGIGIISDATDFVDDDVDLVVGFYYSENTLRFSLRSRRGFDCASFAKCWGGGGHRAAASFSTEWTDVGPTKCFEQLLETHLSSLGES